MKLRSFTLQIFNPELTIPFYRDILGFKLKNEFSEDDATYYDLYLESVHFHIQLKYSPSLKKSPYQQESIDNYWKYSLFVEDIQKIYEGLQEQNHTIGEPYQFGDIGYLSHTTDSENHQIEFIQKTFKNNTLEVTNSPEQKQTALGLLTIRTKDPLKSIKFYEDILGLKLLVRMYVTRTNGFTLYFLGDKSLQTPNPDIDALENREWMYQQSHLFIEIQHYWNSEYDAEFALKAKQNNGLQSINFLGDLPLLKKRLKTNNISFHQNNNKITFETIDKHLITLENSIQQPV
ncbi:VOC family protein [uncultured Croceitalea sp.]|uniref:VOC family protein n=1 Tax=uncultured Croceitalea sp. TaxID=1798908 RepID=UPI0033063932